MPVEFSDPGCADILVTGRTEESVDGLSCVKSRWSEPQLATPALQGGCWLVKPSKPRLTTAFGGLLALWVAAD